MKRIILVLAVIISLTACKKTEIEPEGPTDVRIYNNTGQVFSNVTVSTSGGEFNFGTIKPKEYSSYHRYDKAYPRADISLDIGSNTYSTPKQDYTYMQYMGMMKISYKVSIKDENGRTLKIEVVPESAL